jgi:hypothetical protein
MQRGERKKEDQKKNERKRTVPANRDTLQNCIGAITSFSVCTVPTDTVGIVNMAQDDVLKKYHRDKQT